MEWAVLIFTGIFSTIAAAFVVEPLTALLPDMPLWATLLSVSVFAPLFEEWLCRGLVLRGLLPRAAVRICIL